jgi:subtilisin family serine protease
MSLEEINAPVPSYTGRGVIVGILDSGIDIYHPAFQQGSETRILNIWDQTITAGPVSAEGYGREFTQSDIQRFLPYPGGMPHRDDTGHGTFVASIAAGKRNVGYLVDGVATDALLAIVKLATPSAPPGPAMASPVRPAWEMDERERIWSEEASLFSDGLWHVERVAREYGARSFVVNISLGTSWGPRDGTGLLAGGINRLLLDERGRPVPGRAVVVGAGNERASRRHWRGHVGSTPRAVRMNLRPRRPAHGHHYSNAESFGFAIWYHGPGQIRAELTTNVSPSRSLIASPGDDVQGPLSRLFNARIKTQSLPADNNFHVNCRVVPTSPVSRPIQFEITLTETTGAPTVVDIWAVSGDEGPELTFHGPRQLNTITPESPALTAISVGLYRGGEEDEIGPRSSIGLPLPSGQRMVPDLVAPGYAIEGACARGTAIGDPGSAANTRIYGGTSLAVPFVTGVVALMLGKNPSLTYLDIRRILRESANRNREEIVERQRLQIPRDAEGNHIWGAGKLDARAALARA